MHDPTANASERRKGRLPGTLIEPLETHLTDECAALVSETHTAEEYRSSDEHVLIPFAVVFVAALCNVPWVFVDLVQLCRGSSRSWAGL